MDVVILAAGMGTRLGVNFNNIPKVLLKFRGKSIIEHTLELLSKKGIKNIYFVVGYEKQKVIDFVESVKNKYNINPKFIHQNYPKGVPHAISLFPDDLSDPFFMMVGDTILDAFPSLASVPSIYVKETEEVLHRGIFEVENGKVKNCFYNRGELKSKGLIDTGLMVLSRKIISYAKSFDYKEEMPFMDLIKYMVDNGEEFNLIKLESDIKHITRLEDLEG